MNVLNIEQIMFNGVSHREAEVTELVQKGYTNKVIGEKLGIKEKTVKFHLTNIYKTFQVKSRSELLVKLFNLSPVDITTEPVNITTESNRNNMI